MTMPYKDPFLARAARRAYAKSPLGRATRAKHRISKTKHAPFVGVDGEGGGKNARGQQNYLLLRAGDALLFRDNQHLSSVDCLSFLSGLDSRKLYVAFYFDYDCTHILRDLPAAKLTDLLSRKRPTKGQSDTILWENYEIGFFPRKHLKIRCIDRQTCKPISDFVTIHDVGTFFQTAFVNVLDQWEILTLEQRNEIRADKARRHSFEIMTEREIAYNALECEALALVMEKFREVCVETGYLPRQWEGPGQLAAAMLTKHDIPKTKAIVHNIPLECWRFANDAYYGGRFEILKVGHVKGVREYDICSAYPHAYRSLPCLTHGRWELQSAPGRLPSSGLYVSDVHYQHDERFRLCHLPSRTKTGTLRWQCEGWGRYWSVELDAAIRAGTQIKGVGDVWVYEKRCDCEPFGKWVHEIYDRRKRLGKSVRGYPLKLALNSIYGKCCQSIGQPPFANPIWAGLITSFIRAMLIDAYCGIDPDHVVMLATDGLYVTGKPLNLPIGSDLGQWEVSEPDGLFLIKPGMYAWDAGKKVKTRGVPKALFEKWYPKMREEFEDWLVLYDAHCTGMPWPENIDRWPSYQFPQTLFIGTRLALHLNKPDKAGCWVERMVTHSFDPTQKRRPGDARNGHVETWPHLGGPAERTVYYNKPIGAREDMQAEPFSQQLEIENFEALISGLDDASLFDDDVASADFE